MPSRVASHMFSTMRSSRCTGSVLARLVAVREVGDEALDERDQRRRVVDPRLRVRDAQLDRPVRGREAEIPPLLVRLRDRAAVAGPDRELGELAPARERGRHAGAGPALVQLRAHRREPGVLAAVVRGVRTEREQLGQIAAQRVVDGERAVGAAHRDVDVQPAGQDVARRPRMLGGDPAIALRGRHRSGVARQRVRAGADDEHVGAEAARDEAADRRELARDVGDRHADGRHRLDLRAAQLAREPPIARAERQGVLGGGRGQKRLGVDEQQLFLGADGERRHTVEQAAQPLLERLRAEQRVLAGSGRETAHRSNDGSETGLGPSDLLERCGWSCAA